MASAKHIYMGIYENMEFPEYEFRAYPKWVKTRRKDADGNPISVVVESQAEELRLIDELVPVEEADAVAKERDQLAEQNLRMAKELAELRAKAEPSAPPKLEALAEELTKAAETKPAKPANIKI